MGRAHALDAGSGKAIALPAGKFSALAMQNYAEEWRGVSMASGNAAGGTADNTSSYLDAYTFGLDAAQSVQNITLPGNPNVMVYAFTLEP